MHTTFVRFRGAALALSLTASAALAAAEDFRFDLVSTDHRVGSGAIVEIRLTDLRSGAPVEGAVIYCRATLNSEMTNSIKSMVHRCP